MPDVKRLCRDEASGSCSRERERDPLKNTLSLFRMRRSFQDYFSSSSVVVPPTLFAYLSHSELFSFTPQFADVIIPNSGYNYTEAASQERLLVCISLA